MIVRSLRFRMMLLFSAVVAVLLAVSYAGFYFILARTIGTQFNRRLLDAASPVVADLASDPAEQDVNQLNLPGEYYELLDAAGNILQRSKNVGPAAINISSSDLPGSAPVYRRLKDKNRGHLRLVIVPFQQSGERRFIALAMPTQEAGEILIIFRGIIWFFFPLSLLLTAGISVWYVGRALSPIADLTRHAEEMMARIGNPARRELWTPLPVENPRDELGRLADAFNRLFGRVDAAVRQLRQFVTDASHELRTPLTVLRGETELVLSQPRAPEEYERTLGTIDGELKKLSRIVKGLFTLAMADAGELRLLHDPLYLDEVVAEACQLAAPMARAKEITIETPFTRNAGNGASGSPRAGGDRLDRHAGYPATADSSGGPRPPEGVAFTGDEAFLRQLFFIFLDNAIKYSPAKSSVRVELEVTAGAARVRFEDQGAGIAPADLGHIFERFYRARTPGPPGAPGSGEACSGGLGLAIAQAIARAHGGTIACESTPGGGSTFIVHLPLPAPKPGMNKN